jgi:ABC-type branched-subunit amino acid transport system substrate-binding protein
MSAVVTSGRRSVRRIIALSLGAFALAYAAACSLLVDTNADQCKSDADCASRGEYRVCTLGVCVRPAVGVSDASDAESDQAVTPTTCSANADCPSGSVCRQKDHACISVTSTECPEVVGAYQSDEAVLFGAILPTPLTPPPEYLKNLGATATSMRDGIALAVDDFASDQNPYKGLPPRSGSSARRPIAFVLCGDNHSATSAVDAVKHLAGDLGVPAIIGTAFSTFTRAIATALSDQGQTGVLLLAPRSSDLGPTEVGGSAWLLAIPDEVQGAALSAVVQDREAAIRASLGDAGAGATLRVALVSKGDAYGSAVAAAVKSTLRFNGTDVAGNGTSFRELSYGNSDAPTYTPQFAASVLSIISHKPHVVIIAGTNEAATSLIPAIESGWNEPSFRPRYFLSDGLLVPELWQYLASNDPSGAMRGRLLGTTAAQPGASFDAYRSAFAAKYSSASSIVSGAPAAYDGVYLLAYSAAAIGNLDPNGPNLAQGFAQLRGGGGALTVNVGPAEISSTFSRLGSGQSINLQGVSVPLQLDRVSHGPLSVRPQVWCVPRVNGPAGEAILSGQYVDTSNTVQGTFTTQCAH